MRITLILTFCIVPTASLDAQWRVGAAKESITPEVGAGEPTVWMAGYGPGRPAAGVHDDLDARAIAISDGEKIVVLVALDLIGYFHDQVQQARSMIKAAQAEPKIDYVIICSTHTHAGPDTLGLWGASRLQTGVDQDYLARVQQQIVDVSRQAVANIMPAKLSVAQIDVADMVRDSRRPNVIDGRMTVMRAYKSDDETIATLVAFPCHPESMNAENRLISSDFPGVSRAALEDTFGGISVHVSTVIGGLMAPRVTGNDFAKMEIFGAEIAQRAQVALAGRAVQIPGKIEFNRKPVWFTVGNPHYRAGWLTGVVGRQMFSNKRPVARPPVEDLERTRKLINLQIKSEAAVVGIGPWQWVLVPGELYPEIALGEYQDPQDPGSDFIDADPEPAIYEMMTGRIQTIIGLANDEVGYIIPKCQWDYHAPYCYERDTRQYGEINSCGVNVAPALTKVLAELLEDGQ